MKKKVIFIAIGALSVIAMHAMDQKNFNSTNLIQVLNKFSEADLEQTLQKVPGLVHFADEEGKTLLLHAIEHCQPKQRVEFILRFGAKADVVDKRGSNGLHYAASRVDLDVTRILAGLKISAKTQDAAGDTPLHRLLKNAFQHSNDAMIAQTLLSDDLGSHSYDCSLLVVEDKSKQTPVDIAIEKGNEPVLAIFYRAASMKSFMKDPDQEEQNIQIKRYVKSKILDYYTKDASTLDRLIDSYALSLLNIERIDYIG